MHFGELSLEGGIAKTTKNLIEKNDGKVSRLEILMKCSIKIVRFIMICHWLKNQVWLHLDG